MVATFTVTRQALALILNESCIWKNQCVPLQQSSVLVIVHCDENGKNKNNVCFY